MGRTWLLVADASATAKEVHESIQQTLQRHGTRVSAVHSAQAAAAAAATATAGGGGGSSASGGHAADGQPLQEQLQQAQATSFPPSRAALRQSDGVFEMVASVALRQNPAAVQQGPAAGRPDVQALVFMRYTRAPQMTPASSSGAALSADAVAHSRTTDFMLMTQPRGHRTCLLAAAADVSRREAMLTGQQDTRHTPVPVRPPQRTSDMGAYSGVEQGLGSGGAAVASARAAQLQNQRRPNSGLISLQKQLVHSDGWTPKFENIKVMGTRFDLLGDFRITPGVCFSGHEVRGYVLELEYVPASVVGPATEEVLNSLRTILPPIKEYSTLRLDAPDGTIFSEDELARLYVSAFREWGFVPQFSQATAQKGPVPTRAQGPQLPPSAAQHHPYPQQAPGFAPGVQMPPGQPSTALRAPPMTLGSQDAVRRR
jgi:hypothetical protein